MPLKWCFRKKVISNIAKNKKKKKNTLEFPGIEIWTNKQHCDAELRIIHVY